MSKLFVKVQGCGANQGEAAALSGQLKNWGFELNESDADAFLLHACTVKGDEDPIIEAKESLSKYPNRPIVISGCVTPELKTKLESMSPQITVTKEWNDSREWVRQQFNIQSAHTDQDRLILPNDEIGRIGTVTISSGCLDRCAFCSTVRVKGKLKSIPPEQIIREVKKLVFAGAQEIRLAGQDTACYGFDLNTTLPQLVQQLVAIPGDFKIRLGMGNPRHLRGMETEIAELLHHPKVYQFLHLPIQAGSDHTLEEMKRGHRTLDFLETWRKLKDMVPDFCLSTDIIVAHPGESDTDFEQTLSIIKEIQPYFCNITRFVPRSKTPAANLPQIPHKIAKDRSKILSDLYKEIALKLHTQWLHKKVDLLALELGPKENQWTGRTQQYLKIVGDGNIPPLGTHSYEVLKTSNFGLFGANPA